MEVEMIRSKKLLAGMLGVLVTIGTITVPMEVYATTDDTSQKERMEARIKAREDAGVEAGEVANTEVQTGTIAASLKVEILTEGQKAAIIGEICQQDSQTSGILASVTAAQCILESGYLGTSLAQEANNCFGMKATLSGNSWEGSTWKGEIYKKQTWEEYGGQSVTIMADFRKYGSLEESLADHSAYLLGARNGEVLRYAGLKGEKDYRTAIQIIKDGGYATDSRYVDKICNIIEKYNLTQYDQTGDVGGIYRVRKAWSNKDSQTGAYIDLETAKRECKEGYKVYDGAGNAVYEG